MFPGKCITMWTSGGWLPTPREVFGTGAIVRWHRSHQFDHRPRRRVTSCSFSRSSAETENPQTVSKRWVLPAPFLCFARSFLWPQKPFCCGVFWSFSAWQPVKTTRAGRKRLERTDWAEDEKQSSSVLSERRLVSSPSTCFCAHLQCVSVCVSTITSSLQSLNCRIETRIDSLFPLSSVEPTYCSALFPCSSSLWLSAPPRPFYSLWLIIFVNKCNLHAASEPQHEPSSPLCHNELVFFPERSPFAAAFDNTVTTEGVSDVSAPLKPHSGSSPVMVSEAAGRDSHRRRSSAWNNGRRS